MSGNKENLTLQWARYYTQTCKWSVIPLSPGAKIPPKGFSVVKYRSRIATDEELQDWFAYPEMNIGIITGILSNIFVVDLDKSKPHYREDIALQYFGDDIKSLLAETPSGGQHIFYTFPKRKLTIASEALPAIDYRGEGGYVAAAPSVDGTGKPYRWLQGFKTHTLQEVPHAFLDLLSGNNKSTISMGVGVGGGYVRSDEKPSLQTLQTLHFLQEGQRDQDVFHLANCLSRGGYEKELAEYVVGTIAKTCNPPFPEREAIAKIESAYGRGEKKERNLTQDVRDYISLQDSYIYLTDAYTTLQTLHSSEKANIQVIMHRLCKEGVLEKTGRGTFKKIEVECGDIDIWNADITPLDIKYPFEIETYVDTYPKNIIVVAGEPNAGKTAFLLNFAKKNMDKHEVIYFSSEMGGIELRNRLLKFNIGMEAWKKVTWKERASDFAAMVKPNAVNIIDFLEVHDEFYKVGLFVKQIFDKLDRGIAVIAIQKPKGRDEGLGGQRGLEKPRLYLAMEPGKIKIVKGKNWHHEHINPNGKFRRWKLVAGCKFTGPTTADEGHWEE